MDEETGAEVMIKNVPTPPKEVQVPDFKKTAGNTGRRWEKCDKRKEHVLIEVNGKTYYHRITCKKSNGIRYGKDRL